MTLSRARATLTPGQRAVLSNSVNLSIGIFLLQRPATLSEVAAAHQLLPLEANLRLRQMAEQGLITSFVRESALGTSERVYQGTVDDFELHNLATGDGTENAHHVQLILNQLKRDVVYHALHPEEGKIHLKTIGIRTTAAAFEQWLDRLRAVESEFDQADDAAQESWYFLTVAMYRQPEPEKK